MSNPTSNLENTTIRQASKAQRTEVIKRATDQWGTKVGLEFFTRLHDLVETKEYASNGKLIHWVLVSENDQETLDFYSCCRTFRRDVLVLRPGQEQPTSEIAYAVSGVMTHPSYRGKGYAQRMMTLLHHALAPHIYGGSGIKTPPSVGPASLSVLYSDVGNFYERCGPSSEESGWKLVESISTVWDLPKSLELLENFPDTSLQVQMLTDDQVWALLLSDIPVLEPSPGPTPLIQFAFPPASPNIHMITRSAINPHHVKSSSTFWGAHIPSEGSFITWTFSYGPPHELQINRLKATPEALPILLGVALCEGAKQGCVKAEVWALPEDLLGTACVLLGVNSKRKSSLPAVKWYGREQIDGLEWVMNEQYSWC